MKYLGGALLAFVLALTSFQIRNLLTLRSWKERSSTWSCSKKLWDTALSFLIPTTILVAVFSGIKTYYVYRFNLTYQLLNMSRMLTDITILMIVGSILDYVQGFVKLFWLLRGKTGKSGDAIGV